MAPMTSSLDLFRLSGKVVFLPGGYGGIGEAIAWGAAQAGAKVVVAGRSQAKADAFARQLSDAGHDARGCAMDATSVADIRAAVDFVVGSYGAVDLLVNCVGIQREEPMLDVTEEAFDAVYASNLKAAMFLGQGVAKHQVAAGRGGKQLHFVSVRAQLANRFGGYSAYCSTKGGLAMLIKQHAMELAPRGITVNGIAPTFTFTEMIRDEIADEGVRNALIARIPLGRIGDPKDLVGPAMFLLSPASDFVTGQILYVDGGITASQ